MYKTIVALTDSHWEKDNDPYIFFSDIEFCIRRYILEITDVQSWPNHVGPKRDIPQVCQTRPVFTPFPLKVAWSGISQYQQVISRKIQEELGLFSLQVIIFLSRDYLGLSESILDLDLALSNLELQSDSYSFISHLRSTLSITLSNVHLMK